MHVYTYIEANRRGPDVAVFPPNYGAVVWCMCIRTLKPTDVALMLQSSRRTMAQWCGACVYVHWSQQTWPWCCSPSAELWRSGVVHVYTYIEANRRGPDVAVLPPNYGAVMHVIRGDQGIMQKVLQLVHLNRILQANKIRSNFKISISFAEKIS